MVRHKMEHDGTLSLLEQRPAWGKLNTNYLWIYTCPRDADATTVKQTLQHGFLSVAKDFPWLAGHLIREGFTATNSGLFKVVPRDEKLQDIASSSVHVKDLRLDPSCPSMDALGRAKFDVNMLDEAIFAPRPWFVMEPVFPVPMLLLQATFIPAGGLVVNLSLPHNVVDMAGVQHIARWLSVACGGATQSPEDVRIGNLPRRDIVPLLGQSYVPGDELERQTLPPPDPHAPPFVPPRGVWSSFRIPRASITELKKVANAARNSEYISTDDVLAAFMWQAVTRARLQRFDANSATTNMRSLNVRKVLGLPANMPGCLQNSIYTTLTMGQVANLPLGAVASHLRNTITNPSPSVEYTVRALATALSRLEDKTKLATSAKLDNSKDVLTSSHIAAEVYGFDFGLGFGKPEFVSPTSLVPYEGTIFMLPFTPERDVSVSVCLAQRDMTRLHQDSFFKRYAQLVGDNGSRAKL